MWYIFQLLHNYTNIVVFQCDLDKPTLIYTLELINIISMMGYLLAHDKKGLISINLADLNHRGDQTNVS